jgi:hypothetical protein
MNAHVLKQQTTNLYLVLILLNKPRSISHETYCNQNTKKNYFFLFLLQTRYSRVRIKGYISHVQVPKEKEIITFVKYVFSK